MSILEAMAHGIPTISTNIAAIPEVVQSGVNGMLVEPGDIDALGDALTSLLDDADDRKQMSAAAFELIESTYSLDAHMKQVKELYRLC
jgi:glycosyltransferase involved in cell wall biosynthesis